MRLRIIAGSMGGRMFDSPDSFKTHPMAEKIRGALFNILGDMNGQEVLDAFSGSGALSFESVSRGAKSVIAIDRDRLAQKIIQKNIDSLGLSEKIKLIRASASAWSQNNQDQLFDLILCDPPYNNLQITTLEKLVKHLKPNGLMVLSHSGRESAPTVNGVVVVDKRMYGDAALAVYRTMT